MLSLLLLVLFSVETKALAHELEGERIQSLQTLFEVRRDGTVDVELRFSVAVEGETIKRGPCLHFVTVFEGPGGLILDNEMEVTEVIRDGRKEQFSEELGEGQRSLFLGSKEVVLAPRTYEYLVRYTTTGEWLYRNGEAVGAFDVSGPFRGFVVESAKATIRFPEGVTLAQYVPAVQGALHEGPAYEVEKQGGNELSVSTTGPLGHNHAFFINAVWSTKGFVSKSHWLKLMQQHPRIPLAGFSGLLLLVALLGILIRSARRSAAPLPTAV